MDDLLFLGAGQAQVYILVVAVICIRSDIYDEPASQHSMSSSLHVSSLHSVFQLISRC